MYLDLITGLCDLKGWCGHRQIFTSPWIQTVPCSGFPTPFFSHYNSQKPGLISTKLEEVRNTRICTDLIIIHHWNLTAIQTRKSKQETAMKISQLDFRLYIILENRVGT